MALSSRLRMQKPMSLATIAFYGIAGIIFLVLLPLSGFPPHIALLGIASIIAAYALFMKVSWAKWLVAILFLVATTFAVYTLIYVIAIDALAAVSMIAYVALTWIFTAYVFVTRKREA